MFDMFRNVRYTEITLIKTVLQGWISNNKLATEKSYLLSLHNITCIQNETQKVVEQGQ
jgi:hypothetical protein